LVLKAKYAPKLLYSYVKKKQNVKPQLRGLKKYAGQQITDGKIMAEMLNDQFKSVFISETNTIMPTFEDRTANVCDESTWHTASSANKIIALLQKLDGSKAIGDDGVHPMVLKNAAEGFVTSLKIIFDKSYLYRNVGKLLTFHQFLKMVQNKTQQTTDQFH
jgi:hypothetical protein